MQFMPETWKSYGVDGNKDGLMDPYNPVDAIFAAARYLKAAGADKDIRGAVYAYNHADWYVDSVLLRAQVIGGLPANLVGSLTGPHRGPLPGRRQGDATRDEVTKRSLKTKGRNRAVALEGSRAAPASRSTPTPARRSSRSATSQVTKIGDTKRLGNFVQVQDAYGNTYTYGHLAKISKLYAAPKPQKVDPAEVKRHARAAQAGRQAEGRRVGHRPPGLARRAKLAEKATKPAAEPRRPPRRDRRATSRRSRSACSRTRRARTRWPPAAPSRSSCAPAASTARSRPPARSASPATRSSSRSSRPARRFPPGTVLGRIGRASSAKHPFVRFEIRPAGRGAPRIDPKPILDGWKLLESTAIYRAKGKNPFVGPDAATPDDRPDPADEQGDADAARARRPADPDLRLRPPGHPGRRDRPPRARHARVPRRLGLQPDDHLAQLRPLLPDRLGQRLRAHRPAPPSTSPPSTASRSSATRARARSPSS